MTNHQDYSLFHQFIKTYEPTGFKEIDTESSLMTELEHMMEQNNQFFVVADILQLKILYTSNRSAAIVGVAPTEVAPNLFFTIIHPDDYERFSLGRLKIFKLAQNLYNSKEGNALTSSNLTIRNPSNKYSSLLFQIYLFYSSAPIETVYSFNVYTNVDGYKKLKKHYHYYSGNDLSYFKYPDEELLSIGNIFTDREFEIIKLIESGLNSEQIAAKLFVSLFTINAHRANILKKNNKTTLSEVIHDLKEQGIL
jgi:DNA-binding CsgD family transcriptional regulator